VSNILFNLYVLLLESLDGESDGLDAQLIHHNKSEMQAKFESQNLMRRGHVRNELQRSGLDLSGPEYEPKVLFVDVAESVQLPLTVLIL
jgi:hypothetical protein